MPILLENTGTHEPSARGEQFRRKLIWTDLESPRCTLATTPHRHNISSDCISRDTGHNSWFDYTYPDSRTNGRVTRQAERSTVRHVLSVE